MKISYTKTVELTTKQAILEANEFLASKNVDCRFEIVKPHLNQCAIFIMVKSGWFDDCGGVMYYPSVTDDRTEFEKCLVELLTAIYSK